MPSTSNTRQYLVLIPQLLAAVARMTVAPFEIPPSTLAPTAGGSWLVTTATRSVQIDKGRVKATAAARTFVAPQAELFDSMTPVQRIHIARGTAPRSACDPAKPSTRLRVP